MEETKWKRILLNKSAEETVGDSGIGIPTSGYLIACRDEACEDEVRERQKELLYRVLGPVFFGRKAAGNPVELAALFRELYGIDVLDDFCEGDEHFEEYYEAKQAITEGLSIYDGRIPFQECGVAELAELVWGSMEEEENGSFRRINTMLEE